MHNWVIDYSLSLVNKTGAFYLSRDLVDAFSNEWHAVRRWRSHDTRVYSKYERKLRAKCMLAELSRPYLRKYFTSWHRLIGANYLHMDPLYCINDKLQSNDRVLCHDVGPVSHPELYASNVRHAYTAAYRKIQENKPKMTFVSQASKTAFIEFFGDDYPALDVVPLYLRESLIVDEENIAEKTKPVIMESVAPSFFISVGEVGTRKGLTQSIEGYARSKLHREGVDYVICGPRGLGYEAVAAAARANPGVHLYDYVSDDVLRWLYRNALGFLLLSRLEGFGLPAIEAPFHGLIPVISYDPALVEVTGNHAFMCDPSSADEVAQSLCSVVSICEDDKRERLQLICENAKAFTFQNFLAGWRKILEL